MAEPTIETTPLTLAEIEALALAALIAAGTAPQNAAAMARAAVAAERDGIASHGLLYIPIYCSHVECGKVDGAAVPVVETPRPGVVTVDAATGFAHPAIEAGFKALVPAARAQGIACLAIYNSYNCGVLGYHTERLASDGMLGLGFTNAPASIAPAGGTKPVIGTNPFSLAVPGEGDPALLIDQSASVVAKSEVMKRAREGHTIPEGWGLDAGGATTTDPDAVLKGGSMAPSGGYKGVGIGLLTEVMAAAMTGAVLGVDAAPFGGTAGGPPRTGQFFIAIDPGATSGGLMAERMQGLADAIAGQPGARMPGFGRIGNRARADREGVTVNAALVEKLRELAG